MVKSMRDHITPEERVSVSNPLKNILWLIGFYIFIYFALIVISS